MALQGVNIVFIYLFTYFYFIFASKNCLWACTVMVKHRTVDFGRVT